MISIEVSDLFDQTVASLLRLREEGKGQRTSSSNPSSSSLLGLSSISEEVKEGEKVTSLFFSIPPRNSRASHYPHFLKNEKKKQPAEGLSQRKKQGEQRAQLAPSKLPRSEPQNLLLPSSRGRSSCSHRMWKTMLLKVWQSLMT